MPRTLVSAAVLASLVGLAGCDRARRAQGAQDAQDAQGAQVAPDSFTVLLETSKGPMTIAVHRAWAPHGVDRFYALLQQPFYDEARFFRVVPGFIAQFGLPADPLRSLGFAGSPIPDDPVLQSNLRGTVAFASAGPHTRNSQLFINLRDNRPLDTNGGGYAPIGVVVEGVGVIDSLNDEYGGAPNQDSIRLQGNAFLLRAYPRLDYVRTARIVRRWPPGP